MQASFAAEVAYMSVGTQMEARMTQEYLTEIWEQLKNGQVEGWGGEPYADIDVLTRFKPKTVWQREKPDGAWKEFL